MILKALEQVMILLGLIACLSFPTHGYMTMNDEVFQLTTRNIEEMALDYENDKNSVIAVTEQENTFMYDDFYEEMDNRVHVEQSMDMIFFGPPSSFLRIDSESILHLFTFTMKNSIPRSRVLTAWDIITDGKTAAYLQGREYLAFGKLLNFIPEEELYYVNFGDVSVMKYFANYRQKLRRRKYGVLAAAFRRYYGATWYINSTAINNLGHLLCGFTSIELARITPKIFKELTTEVLGKISKCNYNQTKTLYNIATHTDAYGEPYRWTSNEISRLGLLFTCIPKDDINSIPLEALTAITPSVMKQINQNKLEYFTKQQILRFKPKTRRIYILRMQLRGSLDMSLIAKRSGKSHLHIVLVLLNVITLAF